ncbi:hypothetical protein B0A69_05590 [Chryseobacterium shigense]|uniref:Microcystin-dependent protein n=1 Tax=Chryseobacterium shigense TaxID=297244 RepID=A0A1N7IKR8_9FLAO|nr:hypothetical protein [Chryseobacterium shigense]PQA95842.1 hypothetical protein B0A69_05590 [Chryseobacterium shigense]SIS37694.1 hypothetical protein SAMN05421639_104146 [Chryseobacterium shigense]
MKKINYTLLFLAAFNPLSAQVLITAGNALSPTANSQAVLELYAQNKDKGLLMPKVSLAATNAPNPFPSHMAGMTVYNTNTTAAALTGVTPGFYYNDGTSWNRLEVQLPTVGDIKYSSTPGDQDGWYLLDGRAISGLPSTVQSRAVSLGFATVLPNSADRYLKSKSASETLGAISGNTSVALTQANLPNITYNATTTTNGAHTHAYNDRASGTTNSIEAGSTKTVVDNDSTTSTTSNAGAHNHTFSVATGGTNTALNLQPKYLSAYMFVYLGQ